MKLKSLLATETACLLSLISAAGVFAPTAANATIYALSSDWSDTNNGVNGNPFTYRDGDIPLSSSFTRVAGGFPPSQPVWAPSPNAGNFLPAWFKDQVVNTFPGSDIQLGDVVTHTQDNDNGARQGQSNVVFTSPVSGTAEISGFAFNARDLRRPQEFEVLVNGTVVDGPFNLPGTVVRAHPDTFDNSGVVLNQGDTVELLFQRAPGELLGDFIATDLTINLVPSVVNAVPEPQTWLVLLVGLAILGFYAKSRFIRREW